MGRPSLDLITAKRGGKGCPCEARVKRHRHGGQKGLEGGAEAFPDQFWKQVTCHIPLLLITSLHLQHLLLFAPGTVGGSGSSRDGYRNGRGCCQVNLGLFAEGKARPDEPAQAGLEEESEEAELKKGDGRAVQGQDKLEGLSAR